MDKYEKLLDRAAGGGVEVLENYNLGDSRLKGLYCDGVIALSDKIPTKAERQCVLAEEMGHHFTSVGDITDLSETGSRRQERAARMWAYNDQIGLMGLIRAFQSGCHSRTEAAEYLGVTEEFLTETVDCYRSKYGLYVEIDNYILLFEPCLSVAEKL